MKRPDSRILLIVAALILVTTLLEPGPLRSKLEVDLILSFVPGFGFAIDLLEFLGSGIDPSSWYFYLGLFKLLLEAYITNVAYSWFMSLRTRK
ncbi:MAG: hypothetical protein ACFFDN_22960 [Candidatus Hodarchaeota archaeon]